MLLKRHFFFVTLALSAVLSFLGMVDKADNVTHRVLDLVSSLTWAEAFQPFEMPFPIDAQAFRPFSVLGLKAYASLMGIGPPPLWIAFLKSVACLMVFALGARAWLVAIGMNRYAEMAALLPLGLAPVLFQVWYLPELDLFGAGATLWIAGKILKRTPLEKKEWVGVLSALFFVLFLKESTALVQLSFLGATALMLWLQRLRGARFWRHTKLLLASILVWGAMVLPLMSGAPTEAAKATFSTRISIIEHNLVQVFYLVSGAGAVLIFFGALFHHRFSPKKLTGPMVLTGSLVLLLLPVANYYSHYETIYFTPRAMGIGMALVLFAGLFLGSLNYRREKAMSLCAGQILLVTGALSLAGLIAPSAREDMASRVFVALAPGLFALALYSVDVLKQQITLQGGRAQRAASISTSFLYLCLLYYPFAQGVNYTTDWQARHSVDLTAKKRLVQIETGDLFLFNHYVEWLDPLGLVAAGQEEDVEWTYLHVPAWLPLDRYGDAQWIYDGRLDLREHIESRNTHVYWLSPRAKMNQNARKTLLGDLSWTRKNHGLFTPVAKGLHNRPEDHLWTIFRSDESPLEIFMKTEGTIIWEDQTAFWEIPPNLFELPRRLVSGAPVIENFVYEGKISQIRSAAQN